MGDFAIEVRQYVVSICEPCMNLEGQECHTPECIFFLCGMAEVREYLTRMLLRPTIDGELLPKLQEGTRVPTLEYCDDCDGTGLMEGWNHRDGNSCPKCKGTAVILVFSEPIAEAETTGGKG